jgi:hypothetical protein
LIDVTRLQIRGKYLGNRHFLHQIFMLIKRALGDMQDGGKVDTKMLREAGPRLGQDRRVCSQFAASGRTNRAVPVITTTTLVGGPEGPGQAAADTSGMEARFPAWLKNCSVVKIYELGRIRHFLRLNRHLSEIVTFSFGSTRTREIWPLLGSSGRPLVVQPAPTPEQRACKLN